MKDGNLLKQLFGWISYKLVKLQNHEIYTCEDMNLISSSLVIIAKIIKQGDPLKFKELNEAYINVAS
jgi:hypothetical protein